jgi:hypothetical protein
VGGGGRVEKIRVTKIKRKEGKRKRNDYFFIYAPGAVVASQASDPDEEEEE